MRKGEMPIHQMKSPSPSLQRLDRREIDPYVSLANAIVSVAADDYRTALKENNEDLKNSLEGFFYSKWYKVLTKVDPDHILLGLRVEFAQANPT